MADRRPDDLLPRPPRAPQGPRRAARRAWPTCRPTSGCGSAATGPETDGCEARHAGDPRIEWLGRITDEEKRRRLRGADVFCAPSLRGESFGVVLLEAMAAATPIVASDLAGLPQRGPRRTATPCSCRRATRPRSPTRCEGARPTGRCAAELVASGDERAAEFSMDRLADRYLELYERRVARPAAGAGRAEAGCATGSGAAPTAVVSHPVHSRRSSIIVRRRSSCCSSSIVVVTVQRPGQAAEPDRERLGADRRAAQAPLRPDPEPRRDGEGLRRPRARDARGGDPGPQHGA